MKIYELCESSSIVQKIQVHLEKHGVRTNILGHSCQVVLILMFRVPWQRLYCYILYMDNSYNSAL